MKRPSQSAFTLVELLVVLAIVALLTGLLMSVIAKAKEQGLTAQSANNIRQLALANLAYAADHGTYVPADNQSNNKRWCGGRTGNQPYDPTKGYLSPYFGNSRKVTPCPIFSNMLKASGTFEEGAGGYGYNACYIGGKPSYGYGANGVRIPASPIEVERLAGTVMFASTAYARTDGVQENPYAEPPFWDFGNGVTDIRSSPTVHFRFRGKALVAWCDAHVSFESRSDLPLGENPHGGDAAAQMLGWFGTDKENGYWNPNRPEE